MNKNIRELSIAYEVAAAIRLKSFEAMDVKELRQYAEDMMNEYHREMIMAGVHYEDVEPSQIEKVPHDFHDVIRAMKEITQENYILRDELRSLNQELIAKDN